MTAHDGPGRGPNPTVMVITPRSANPSVRPLEIPPAFSHAGTGGQYVSDTGPLLCMGSVQGGLALLRAHFGDRLKVPAKVHSEVVGLAGRDGAVGDAARAVVVSFAEGFPAVETPTDADVATAEGALLEELARLPPALGALPAGSRPNLGECHALALVLRLGRDKVILLTNDGRAARLARRNGVCARSVNGLLRELCRCEAHGHGLTPERAFADLQLMQAVSSPPADDRARQPSHLA